MSGKREKSRKQGRYGGGKRRVGKRILHTQDFENKVVVGGGVRGLLKRNVLVRSLLEPEG